jgi:hypothetical protein
MTIEQMMFNFHHGGMTKFDSESFKKYSMMKQ